MKDSAAILDWWKSDLILFFYPYKPNNLKLLAVCKWQASNLLNIKTM